MPCEFKVALIATGHGHDGTCAIARQHVLAYPHWYLLSVKRINTICACKGTGNFLYFRHAVYFRTAFHVFQVSVNLRLLLRSGYLFHQHMFGGNHHKVNPKDGIWAGGEDGYGLIPQPLLRGRRGGASN